MELRPGVAAAMLVATWSARRSGRTSLDRLADLIPLSIIGYAGFEVACLVRDGCYWPESPLGLQPPGTSTRMLPIGAAAAIAVVAGATLPRRRLGRRPSSIVLLGGVAIVAGVRSLASIWLPHIGGGQSRQHWSSIVVFVTTFFALAVTSVARRPMTPARTERMSVRTSTSVDEPTAIDPPPRAVTKDPGETVEACQMILEYTITTRCRR